MQPLNHNFKFLDSDKYLCKIPKDKIEMLENDQDLSIADKIGILCLFSNNKWITDIGINASDKLLLKQKQVLRSLDIPFYIEECNGTVWLQAGANSAVLEYVKNNKETLTDVEAGLLYGYPLTHVFGFIGVLDSYKEFPINSAEYFLSGIFSKDFYSDESNYFLSVWNDIKKISPNIVSEAQNIYDDAKRNL